MPPPPAKPVPPPLPPAGGLGPRDPQIMVIPEASYGVALRMEPPFFSDDDQPAKSVPSPVPAAPPAPAVPAGVPVVPPASTEHHARLWLLLLAILIPLLGGGVWIYWNRAALFGPPPAALVVVPPPVAPNAPTELAAMSTNPGAVRLEWTDQAESEDGFRVERKTGLDPDFSALQTLPANSRTFLDQTAPPGGRAAYRVVAFNEAGDSASSTPIEVAVLDVPALPPTAPALPPDGLDSDSDGLTDAEERTYAANPQLPDTDGDGYLDGNEVFNLYAPTVKAPATLLSLPSMRTVSSTVGWQTLVPQAWQEETAPSGTEVLLRIPSGESFVFRIEANPDRQTLEAWLQTQKGIRPDQAIPLASNKYRVPFALGPDRLTAYVLWEDKVLVVAYQLGGQPFVNFRTDFGMVLNALRLNGSPRVPDLSQPSPIPTVFQGGPMPNASSTVEVPAVAPPASSTIPAVPVPPMSSSSSSVSTASSSRP